MATLRDAFVLTILPNENSFLGVNPSNIDDCVLVTCKTGFIKSYKVGTVCHVLKYIQYWKLH